MNMIFAEATCNSFVILDRLFQPLSSEHVQELYQVLIESDRDDALILTNGLVREGQLTLEMKVLGRDGQWGEFCGNGALACASYLFGAYPQYDGFALKQYALSKGAEGCYSVVLPIPVKGLSPRFLQGELPAGIRGVEVIEPHLVLQQPLSDQELISLGEYLNRDRQRFPCGINLNACWWKEDILYVRTYERGAGRLTAACGTGSVASAFVMKPLGDVQVMTQGGRLDISYLCNGVQLRGRAFS